MNTVNRILQQLEELEQKLMAAIESHVEDCKQLLLNSKEALKQAKADLSAAKSANVDAQKAYKTTSNASNKRKLASAEKALAKAYQQVELKTAEQEQCKQGVTDAQDQLKNHKARLISLEKTAPALKPAKSKPVKNKTDTAAATKSKSKASPAKKTAIKSTTTKPKHVVKKVPESTSNSETDSNDTNTQPKNSHDDGKVVSLFDV